jgi:hypothetical protein
MTADWRRIELSREQILAGELEKVRAQLSLFMMTSDAGGDIAVFTRRTKNGACEVFFPPTALQLCEFVFERHPPQLSRAPALLGTTLLLGNHASVATLLGKSSDVQSFRKTIDAAVSVDFLHQENTAAQR